MVSKFLNFDKMITPLIIKVLFWIGAGLTVILGFIQIIQGMNTSFGGGGIVFSGLLTILLGPLFVRIYCELLIIFFKVNETLSDIKETLANNNTPPPASSRPTGNNDQVE